MAIYPSWLTGITGMSNEAFWRLVAIPTATLAESAQPRSQPAQQTPQQTPQLAVGAAVVDDPQRDPDQDEDACWLWRGRRSGRNGRSGYGRYDLGARVLQAHRYAYEQVKGPIPTGYVITHTCDEPLCVRPSHLEAISRRAHQLRHPNVNTPERFWSRVSRNDPVADPDGCWLWQGELTARGFTRVRVHGVETTAHQHAWALTYGALPAESGLKLLHRCGNHRCVRPDHLQPSSHLDTMQRYWQSVTHCRQGHALTPENTYQRGNERHCRTCRRERVQRYRVNRKARQTAENDAARNCTDQLTSRAGRAERQSEGQAEGQARVAVSVGGSRGRAHDA